MSIIFQIENIAKSYNGKPVLANCSFSFDKKGIYVLRGSNGAGKSTLLRICALLEKPDKGKISFYSSHVILAKNIVLQRQISLVLPKVGVFNRSVAANVAYPLKIRHIPQPDVIRRVKQILELVGLYHKKNQPALTLSSGETQRMGMARALVIEPEILFLDEPTASIDDENTLIIENLLKTLKQNGRTTIIMTTHDSGQAHRVGDYVLWLKNGQLMTDFCKCEEVNMCG
jgi:tungstate transport system ATP-binding protein